MQHPELTGENAVYFVPSFFIDPATFKDYSGVMHGAFNVRHFFFTLSQITGSMLIVRYSSIPAGPSLSPLNLPITI